MYKIGILYICTGKYDVFWKEFYKSCEKYFLSNHEKHYYVFTDSDYIYNEGKSNRINKIYQENLGWPNNTLKRFEIFNNNKKYFENCDYIFFMNANLLFKKYIKEDFLPITENLTFVKHPGFYNKKNSDFTYERNMKSKAYISNGEGKYYVAGGLNGGKTKYFLKLIDCLDKNIKLDLKEDIIALWHDESHINRYIIDRDDIKILEPEYLYPEGDKIPFDIKILIRDKAKYGGHSYLRGENISVFLRIKQLLKSKF